MNSLAGKEERVRRILLVDDEVDILESLRELLEASIDDLEVLTAPSGDDAVKILKEQRIDILVTDFKMPGMNGLELMRESQRIAPKTPRVLMTAFPDLQIAIESINEARIENFFTKPLDPEEVVRVLEAMLDDRKLVSQRERAFARAMDVARRKAEGGEDA